MSRATAIGLFLFLQPKCSALLLQAVQQIFSNVFHLITIDRPLQSQDVKGYPGSGAKFQPEQSILHMMYPDRDVFCRLDLKGEILVTGSKNHFHFAIHKDRLPLQLLILHHPFAVVKHGGDIPSRTHLPEINQTSM